MKGRARTMRRWSTNRDERLCKYLKPGALAQLRDCKITARSQKHDLQAQISLYLLNSSEATTSSSVTQNAMLNQPNGFPCFALRVNRPRCLHRKKLVAVPPIFVESEPL